MGGNINTRSYWELRFTSGDWEAKRGRWQTHHFAAGQMPFLHLEKDFDGTLLDFGCGLGDAMPVYKEHYPKATLIGVDISEAAIKICKASYGSFAHFESGDVSCVPEVDVIISSNVLEHLDDDCGIARYLLSKCRHLYVITPYQENPLSSEHLRSYDKHHFQAVGSYSYRVFPCPGWSQYGLNDLWFHVRVKNVARFFLERRLVRRNLQIMYHFVDAGKAAAPARRSSAGRRRFGTGQLLR
jgi:SAM-dependent methyltransferase